MIARLIIALSALWVSLAHAQELDPKLIAAADSGALAYVITGDDKVDDLSRLGLRGLSETLAQRTTVEPGEPVGIDLDQDDISVLTFLYWPITDTQPMPSPQAYVRLNHFLRSGGMILFDTRDGEAGDGPEGEVLQQLAAPLDVPPLAPVPPDHVLTRAYYLLSDFPGRWTGTTLWAEASTESTEGAAFRTQNDGVSPVLIGSNDWAAAWATDDNGLPVTMIGSGWQGEEQREMALRFGVNLIMYVLTGNYKSDQVHVPALLDRLGQEAGDPFAAPTGAPPAPPMHSLKELLP